LLDGDVISIRVGRSPRVADAAFLIFPPGLVLASSEKALHVLDVCVWRNVHPVSVISSVSRPEEVPVWVMTSTCSGPGTGQSAERNRELAVAEVLCDCDVPARRRGVGGLGCFRLT
jgi:hypothetical protein